jgi:hypothetical protein
MNKLLVIFLLSLSWFTLTQNKLTVQTSQVLKLFIQAEEQNSLMLYDIMAEIFMSTPLQYKKICKAIRADIASCRKFIKKYAQDSCEHNLVLEQLRSLYIYIRNHKECYEAIHFYENLQSKYQLAFNNPYIVQSVESAPALYGVDKCKYKCRAYFRKVTADLRKVEKFEDKIHADYAVLKAHNYVYKIELIKLRNYIYHNNIYKFETRYF